MTIFSLAVFIFLSFSCFFNEYAQGYETSLIYTKETEYTLGYHNDKKLLTLDRSKTRYHLFGIYKNLFSKLSGYYLYIFPNKKYVISKWCDICMEITLDYGIWEFQNENLILKSKTNNEKQKYEEDLINIYGIYYGLNFYVASHNEGQIVEKSFLISNKKLEELKKDKYFIGFFEKIVDFFDWNKVYKELVNHM